jgi:hypothetical protein
LFTASIEQDDDGEKKSHIRGFSLWNVRNPLIVWQKVVVFFQNLFSKN